MAKLTSQIRFNGSLDGLSAYTIDGLDATIVRRKGGPSRKQVLHDPRFSNTRKNNKETAGRSLASGLVLDTLGELRPVVDQSCCGRLNALLKVVQAADKNSPWGQRSVRLSLRPGLLEGFNLRKVYPLEGVVRSPINCSLNREALSAEVAVPALVPGINFFSPPAAPLFRVVAALGAVPDLYYHNDREHYYPSEDFLRVSALSAHIGWLPVKGGMEAATLRVQLPDGPGVDDFSLVLTVGVQWGTVGVDGSVEVVKKVKSARIERVG